MSDADAEWRTWGYSHQKVRSMPSNSHVACLLVLMQALALPPAQALDPTCLIFVDAADKSAHQAARQSVMETDGDTRMEAIVVDDVLYSKINGKWMKVRSGFWALERGLVADMRNGTIQLTQCRSTGREVVDGIETTVIEYTMTAPGADPVSSRVYVGKDGLIYAQSSTDFKVRYRYQGVHAPKL